jgi:prolyl 4-hydroxylase
MHHMEVSTNFAWLPHNVDPEHHPTPEEYEGMPIQPLGDVKQKHDEHMASCMNFYNETDVETSRCWFNERDRVEQSLRQPQSMRNYTELGYTKIRTPEYAYKLIKEFYDANKHREKPERWAHGNIYT